MHALPHSSHFCGGQACHGSEGSLIACPVASREGSLIACPVADRLRKGLARALGTAKEPRKPKVRSVFKVFNVFNNNNKTTVVVVLFKVLPKHKVRRIALRKTKTKSFGGQFCRLHATFKQGR